MKTIMINDSTMDDDFAFQYCLDAIRVHGKKRFNEVVGTLIGSNTDVDIAVKTIVNKNSITAIFYEVAQ